MLAPSWAAAASALPRVALQRCQLAATFPVLRIPVRYVSAPRSSANSQPEPNPIGGDMHGAPQPQPSLMPHLSAVLGSPDFVKALRGELRSAHERWQEHSAGSFNPPAAYDTELAHLFVVLKRPSHERLALESFKFFQGHTYVYAPHFAPEIFAQSSASLLDSQAKHTLLSHVVTYLRRAVFVPSSDECQNAVDLNDIRKQIYELKGVTTDKREEKDTFGTATSRRTKRTTRARRRLTREEMADHFSALPPQLQDELYPMLTTTRLDMLYEVADCSRPDVSYMIYMLLCFQLCACH